MSKQADRFFNDYFPGYLDKEGETINVILEDFEIEKNVTLKKSIESIILNKNVYEIDDRYKKLWR